jgi:hypothetical protein
MKIKGSSVAAIGIGAFLTGVAAGVAACRKDCLKAAGQFFGGVVGGAGAPASRRLARAASVAPPTPCRLALATSVRARSLSLIS